MNGSTRTVIVAATAAAVVPYATDAAPPATLAVSYTDVPPALNLTPYVGVDVPVDAEREAAGLLPEAAVLPDGGVILVDDPTAMAHLVGRDGSVSSVALDVVPQVIVASPGPVVYGLVSTAEPGLETVAVALAGPRAGEVVARQPVADPGLYLEVPTGLLGNSPDGVVDRGRDVGAVLIGHVDLAGNPAQPDGFTGLWSISDDDVVSAAAAPGTQWTLSIEHHPSWVVPFAGPPPPAPSSGGRGVYPTTVGPPDPSCVDICEPTQPVLAVLEPGGGGTWYSIPSGWTLVASDTGGTIFARRSGERVELARLDDALASPRPCPEYTDNDRYPLRLCDSGEAVRVAQLALRATVAPDLAVDGYFGPNTDAAVREFQQTNELAVDGLVGPRTWAALTPDFVFGRDEDGSGVVDPWELDPTPEVEGFPEDSPPECDGCPIWAVVLAAGADLDDPGLAAGEQAAADAGYAAYATGCDHGAAEALGAPPDWLTVSVYFATQDAATAAQEAFAARDVPSVVAEIVTGCLH